RDGRCQMGCIMIDNTFRKWLPSLTTSLISVYSRTGITPNRISLLSLAFAFVAAVLCVTDYLWAAAVVWWIGRLLDGTDGIYARASGQESDFGAYLDIVCDMASYSL